jgi:hypothetical protein
MIHFTNIGKKKSSVFGILLGTLNKLFNYSAACHNGISCLDSFAGM